MVNTKNYYNLITIIRTVIIAMRSTRFSMLASLPILSLAPSHHCDAEALDSLGVLGLPSLFLVQLPSLLLLTLKIVCGVKLKKILGA
jgi:hypothetical protein